MTNKFFKQLLLSTALITAGCANHNQVNTKQADDSHKGVFKQTTSSIESNKQLRTLTDQILIALGSRQYKQLSKLYPPKYTSTYIAQQLLGQQLYGAIIDNWFVEDIKLHISDDGLTATTQTITAYRLDVRHHPKQATFTLHFKRAHQQATWQPTILAP